MNMFIHQHRNLFFSQILDLCEYLIEPYSLHSGYEVLIWKENLSCTVHIFCFHLLQRTSLKCKWPMFLTTVSCPWTFCECTSTGRSSAWQTVLLPKSWPSGRFQTCGNLVWLTKNSYSKVDQIVGKVSQVQNLFFLYQSLLRCVFYCT